ncbi:hypothetical protein ABSA28_01098 [Candidatus Hepatincolaceae symbiont of Richtersius coronifer]
MFLYFFDLDDTICNTKSMVNAILKEHSLEEIYQNFNPGERFKSIEELYTFVEDQIYIKGYHNIEILENSIFKILRTLLEHQKHEVYYITARYSRHRDHTIQWLKKHDLWIDEDKLIMDTHNIKGFTVNNLLKERNKQFAFFFDDLASNHEEAAAYKNIISCVPY